ncbi:SDR family oxidoreductase [Cellulophaga sp. F20128]|uniref:SDR family oxidoreductase n=1 Tax=Cellulophaga sp. F20128 TaxID=2926413 RepID=UPI001FF350E2|nr:SDR family oxidoreductase [Cellulophaga sp. F20128]MCK0156324.1 SDR family oxidoreductase [Cellulophaga sp. F20128]
MNNLFDIKDKVAVITGGAGVLGSTAAKSLAIGGVKTILLGRNLENTQKVADEINKNYGEAQAFKADVLNKTELEAVRDKILNTYGKIDILVNIAGGNLPGATIGPDQTIFDLNMDDFDKVSKLNLQGTVIPSIVFGKVMADQNSGVIINYSSMAVPRVITRVAGYSASKAAMENFTRWMAVEMATKYNGNIRVNAIAPGFFIGKQNKSLLTNTDGSYTDRGNTIIKNTPMNRFGEADELNGALHFLCSNASKFITGAVIPVDGGFSVFSGV